MSEYAPASAAGKTAGDARSALTPEAIEAVLADFRGWLQQAAEVAWPPAPMGEPEFSWQTLVAEFTALRQEVNLQTRAARTQAEQSTKALEQLEQALAAVEESRDVGSNQAEGSEEILRPVLKSLVDVHDAMSLAQREVLRVQQGMNEMLARAMIESTNLAGNSSPPTPLPKRERGEPARWRWWPIASLATTQPIAVQEQTIGVMQASNAWNQAADHARQMIASVLVGYTMGLQRIERTLQQQELEAIECVGQPFDPECMEVVEVINEPGRQGTEVIGEVRRGYHWHGKIFRYAQVRVTRP